MSVVKAYCKIETSPWALTLNEPVPERAFELPAPAWPQKFQPGDSDVFLHDVVFLIDRHNCVARSTGKVSRGQFFFSQGMLLLGSNHFLIYSFRTNVNDLWGKLLRVRKKFFWPIRSGQFKRFWNWFGKSKCPGARLDLTVGSLSMQRFWATDGNRKWTIRTPSQWSFPDCQTKRLYKWKETWQ